MQNSNFKELAKFIVKMGRLQNSNLCKHIEQCEKKNVEKHEKNNSKSKNLRFYGKKNTFLAPIVWALGQL